MADKNKQADALSSFYNRIRLLDADKEVEMQRLKEELAKLVAEGEQDTDKVSDADIKRALEAMEGAEKKYTGGKVGDKYYGGGPVYPRPAKSD